MNVENAGKGGCPQRDSAEHEGYAEARRSFNRIWKERDSAQSDLLEKILYKDNFNRAYKRVKKNHGAPGIDGMTVEEALPYLRDHQKERSPTESTEESILRLRSGGWKSRSRTGVSGNLGYPR